jgi:hypothetical protein
VIAPAREQAENVRLAQNDLHYLIGQSEEQVKKAVETLAKLREEHARLCRVRERLISVGHFVREEAGL